MADFIPEDLFAGQPVIETRWRMHAGALPLKNRLLRAFEAYGVSNGLASWARQHIEWTLAEGSIEQPDGVLVIDVDDAGRAAMTLEAYKALPACTAAELLDRVAAQEGSAVEAEVLWVLHEGALCGLAALGSQPSGVNSLVIDLGKTLGLNPAFVGHEGAERLVAGLADGDECFLASDEHGVVPAEDFCGETAARFVGYYERIVSVTKPDRMGLTAQRR